MPAVLTQYFKIFKSNYAALGNVSNLCILSAHGGGTVGSFQVPHGLTILFPSWHGEGVKMWPIHPNNNAFYNTHLGRAVLGRVSIAVNQRITSGQACPNYELEKFQGRHNSKWPRFISYPITRRAEWANLFGEESYPDIQNAIGTLNADVVTVRNRQFDTHTITLAELVTFLHWSASYNYTHLFCAICRSSGGFSRWILF